MTTITTPVYGIAYCDTLTPIVGLAAVTESAAKTTEAALIRGGVAPADVQALIASGAFSDTGEIALPLVAGVTGLSGMATTYRRIGKRVTLTGAVSGTFTSGMTICTLPVGFRSLTYQRFITATNDATTTGRRLNIDTSGNVIVNGSGTGSVTWQALDGVTFLLP